MLSSLSRLKFAEFSLFFGFETTMTAVRILSAAKDALKFMMKFASAIDRRQGWVFQTPGRTKLVGSFTK